MDNATLIDHILEAERSARAISEDALARLNRQEEDLAAQREQIRAHYQSRCEKQLEELRRTEQSKKAQALAAQDARLADAGDKMERAYARYGDNWVDTLFRQAVDLS